MSPELQPKIQHPLSYFPMIPMLKELPYLIILDQTYRTFLLLRFLMANVDFVSSLSLISANVRNWFFIIKSMYWCLFFFSFFQRMPYFFMNNNLHLLIYINQLLFVSHVSIKLIKVWKSYTSTFHNAFRKNVVFLHRVQKSRATTMVAEARH